MRQTIEFAPACAMATIDLDPGESLTVEAQSMVGMSDGLAIKSRIGGTGKGFFGAVIGFLAAPARRIFGGEIMLLDTCTPRVGRTGRVLIAPAMPGDIIHCPMDGAGALTVRRTSYLASAGDVKVESRFGGLKSFFSGERGSWLSCSGTGDLWLGSHGAFHEIRVEGGHAVDSGLVVAFDDTLDCSVRDAGGPASSLLGGGGLIRDFSGHGRLFIQSRSIDGMVRWLTPRLRG